MKRELTLYIGNQAVELGDDSLIVMNYTAEELSNPTIVKNSYSQQISIPSTPNNDKIFGAIYRLDRSTISSTSYTGVNFSPLVRTPFVIYDSLGRIVESGYMKLDSIKRVGNKATYGISLYGGLGSFFYSMSYDDEGNKLTLADLPYIDGSDGELDFNITAEVVRNAWGVIAGQQLPSGSFRGNRWEVLNFVPAYNGIPEDFDASKAVAKITDSQGRLNAFGVTLTEGDYSTINGWTLLNLGKDYTGEDMKEFRSYLQRPAISFRHIVEGVQALATTKGFSFNLDPDFFNASNPYYDKAWMLLPSLRSVEFASGKKVGSLTGGQDYTSGADITLPLQFSEDITELGQTSINASVDFSAFYDNAFGVKTLRFTKGGGVFNICCVMQLIVTTEGGTDIGSNLVIVMDNNTSTSGTTLVQNLESTGYTPIGSPQISECRGYYTREGAGFKWVGDDINFEVSGNNIVSARLRVTWNVIPPQMYAYIPSLGTEDAEDVRWRLSFNGTFEFASFTGARTGSLFTKKSLLRSEYSPIDYLLSYAKSFGLVFSYDKENNSVSLQPRNSYYAGGETIDLSKRIDYSQSIDITPNMIESRFLEFKNESEGAYVESEEQRTGRAYGSQRVNTGDEFSKETKTAIEGNAFKGCAQVLRRSKYNTILSQDGYAVPSVFVDADITYTLYNNNEGKEFPITTPDITASITYLNPSYPTYDAEPRLQLHESDNKMLDISDILVFYNGTDRLTPTAYQRFRITDDDDSMIYLNEGNPCWLMDMEGILDTSLPLPRFGRYVVNGSIITHSLDFGTPEQIDIPNITHPEGVTLYERFWQAFLADRYNVDTRVVRAKVDLRGLRVGENLLRNFYFFENSFWVLNRIINYSLTGDVPVECEFIKVHNQANYTQGQNY